MKVSYEKKMREDAKANKQHLFTIQVTWPSGKSAYTAQGPCDRKTFERIIKFSNAIITAKESRRASDA